MISGGGQGWATTLADLSIILFMLTAADLSNAELARNGIDESHAAVATAEPVAIYRPGGGAIPLAEWLANQPDDPGARLTVLVRHVGDSSDAAIAQGLALAAQAEKAGHPARMIVEQAERPDLAVILAYDSDPNAVARKLLSPQGTYHH